MARITPRTLISDAYRSLLVTRPGQSTSDDAIDEAFRALNDLVDSWQIERLMIYNVERAVYPLAAGVASYTLGPGGTLGRTRPPRTDGRATRDAGAQLPVKGWPPTGGSASLDASYQFPEGYVRALKWNLAMELAAGASIQKKLPEVLYEHIARNAVDSRAAIKSFHSSPPPTLDASDGGALGYGCGGGYDVYRDM